MPTKVWAVGEEVLAADFNDYVQEQVVATFPNATARNAAIPAPLEGMVTYLADVQALQLRESAAWRTLPRGLVASAEMTVNSADAVSTPLPIPGLQVAATVPAGRILAVHMSVTVVQVTTGPSMVRLYLREGATDLLIGYQYLPVNNYATIGISRLLRPPAGAHTFTPYLSTDSGGARVEGSTGIVSTVQIVDIGGV